MKHLVFSVLFFLNSVFCFGQPISQPTMDGVFMNTSGDDLLKIWSTQTGATSSSVNNNCIDIFELFIRSELSWEFQDGKIKFSSLDIQTALNNLAINQIVQLPASVIFPAGNYYIDDDNSIIKKIKIPSNIVIKGEGAETTTLTWRGFMSNANALISFEARDNTNLNPDIECTNSGIECIRINGSGINVNGEKPIQKNEFNSIGFLCGSEGQLKNHRTTPEIDKLTSKSLIEFKGASNCWVKNCITYMGFGTHIGFKSKIKRDDDNNNIIWQFNSNNNTIEGNHIYSNWLHGRTTKGGGKQGYGIHFSGIDTNQDGRIDDGSSNNLIENNIIHDTRHGIVIQEFAKENVIAYNYIFDSWSYNMKGNETGGNSKTVYRVHRDSEMDISIHGFLPLDNLFEGNVVNYLVVDTYRYSNNLRQFFYRNKINKRFWIQGRDPAYNCNFCGTSKNRGQIVLGNVGKNYDISSTSHTVLNNIVHLGGTGYSIPSVFNHCSGQTNGSINSISLGQSCYLTQNIQGGDWIPDNFTFPIFGEWINNSVFLSQNRNSAYSRYPNNVFNPEVVSCPDRCQIDTEDPELVELIPEFQGHIVTNVCNDTRSIYSGEVVLTGGVPLYTLVSQTFTNLGAYPLGSVFVSPTDFTILGSGSVLEPLNGILEVVVEDNFGTIITITHHIYCGSTNGNPVRIQQQSNEFEGISERQVEAIGIEKIIASEAKIFPNPMQNRTTLSYNVVKESEVNIRLINAFGQVQRNLMKGKQKIGIYNITIDKEDLASGIYFCEVQIGTYRKVIKILIE